MNESSESKANQALCAQFTIFLAHADTRLVARRTKEWAAAMRKQPYYITWQHGQIKNENLLWRYCLREYKK